MKVSAQKVVEEPQTVVTQEVARTGKMPPAPPAPKPDVPILVVFLPAGPVETASAESAPTALPKTASDLPLIGLLGVLLCGISLAAMAIRGTLSRLASLKG